MDLRDLTITVNTRCHRPLGTGLDRAVFTYSPGVVVKVAKAEYCTAQNEEEWATWQSILCNPWLADVRPLVTEFYAISDDSRFIWAEQLCCTAGSACWEHSVLTEQGDFEAVPDERILWASEVLESHDLHDQNWGFTYDGRPKLVDLGV